MYEISFILHDAVRATGIPAATLQYFIRKGELPTVKVGRARVIRRSSLNKFLSTYEVRSLGGDEERTNTGVVHDVIKEHITQTGVIRNGSPS